METTVACHGRSKPVRLRAADPTCRAQPRPRLRRPTGEMEPMTGIEVDGTRIDVPEGASRLAAVRIAGDRAARALLRRPAQPGPLLPYMSRTGRRPDRDRPCDPGRIRRPRGVRHRRFAATAPGAGGAHRLRPAAPALTEDASNSRIPRTGPMTHSRPITRWCARTNEQWCGGSPCAIPHWVPLRLIAPYRVRCHGGCGAGTKHSPLGRTREPSLRAGPGHRHRWSLRGANDLDEVANLLLR